MRRKHFAYGTKLLTAKSSMLRSFRSNIPLVLNNLKPEIYRRTLKEIGLTYSWARSRQPELTEEKFRRMLVSLEPAYENSWLRDRNEAAHSVTIAEAKPSLAPTDLDQMAISSTTGYR